MADTEPSDQGIFTRHFGAVITAIVSVIAIAFGFLQFYLADSRIAQEKRVEQDRADRAWKLALTEFGTKNYNEIFSDDEAKRTRLRALMKATFPSELLQEFYREQTKTATTFKEVRESSEAYAAVSSARQAPSLASKPTIYLQYADAADSEKLTRFLETLRGQGFRTPGRELVTKFRINADVRYFHEGDRAAAERALAALRTLLGSPKPEKPTNLSARYENVPEGIIEVWVPKLANR